MTVPCPQSLEKKEHQQKLFQAHIPTFWSLLYICVYIYIYKSPLKDPFKEQLLNGQPSRSQELVELLGAWTAKLLASPEANELEAG